MFTAGTVTGANVIKVQIDTIKYIMDLLYFLPQFLQFHKYQNPGVHVHFATQNDYTIPKRAGISNTQF